MGSMVAGNIFGPLIDGGITAFGQSQQGREQQAAYMYNAQVAQNNAKAAAMNAQLAGEAGAAQAEARGMQNKSTFGQIKANQGASGLDVNTGSAVQVRQSAKELGLLDTQTIRSNASRQAYGYQVQQANFVAQSGLDKYEGEEARSAAGWQEMGTMLGAGEDSYSNFTKDMMFMG